MSAFVLLALFAAEPEATRPVVVAKGKGFLVHAIPRTVPAGILGLRPGNDTMVLHTALPGGEAKVLLRSGTAIGLPMPMGINRTPYSQTRVVGLAADAERLYVLEWSARWQVLGMGAGDKGPPASDAYAVKVFWLADGSEVGSYKLSGDKRPKTVPEESVKAGPLSLEKGGVSAYGEILRFEGKKRAK